MRQMFRFGGLVRTASVALRPMPRAISSATMAPSYVMYTPVFRSFSSRAGDDALPPSLIEKYRLDDPTRWVPLTVGGFSLATLTGLYHWDAESQMLGLFVLFVGTIYTQGGAAIGKYFDDISDQILKEHQAVEDAQINAVKLTIDAYKEQTTILSDIQSIAAFQNDLVERLIKAAPRRLEHNVVADITKKLDTIVAAENEFTSWLQKTLVSEATESIIEDFEEDEELQESSLEAALAMLEDPTAQKKDTVGDMYKAFFADFKKMTKEAEGQEVDLYYETAAEMFEEMKKLAKRDNIPVFEPDENGQTTKNDLILTKFKFKGL